jgi:hypothetical protein
MKQLAESIVRIMSTRQTKGNTLPWLYKNKDTKGKEDIFQKEKLISLLAKQVNSEEEKWDYKILFDESLGLE